MAGPGRRPDGRINDTDGSASCAVVRLDILLRRGAERSDLVREMNRLVSRIDTTELPYDRKAMLYAAAMIEDEDSDYNDIRMKVMDILPPFI